ncbi:hypothetical protein QJS10_CPB19g00187 [Acorus calamus]|uniref:Uncharacterized protein n=1 Tax=Acorus calamus TaxID=4465 RepID=A0AAV9CIR1_ACOCL|nr:hypothetical protein QJS10_CPB19g00187 [Acorus calamus]
MDFSDPNSSPPHLPTPTHPTVINNGEDVDGERFGVILSRTNSASTTTNTNERNHNISSSGGIGAVQAALKRAFSMRTASSGGEGYCRIHDQSELIQPSFDGDVGGTRGTPRKRRGRFIKACKWIFGF